MNLRIKEVRKRFGLTQEELGNLIGISGAGIARIESGASKPTEAAVKLICATYGVSYQWLTTGEGQMELPMDSDAMIDTIMKNESTLAKTIMKAFAKLPDEEWIKLRDLIDRIKKEGV